MPSRIFVDRMSTPHQIIYIQPAAPAKPVVGAACNGCGVCCLVAPCPLGVILSGRRTGACDALRWEGLDQEGGNTVGFYRCGAITQPDDVLFGVLPRALKVGIPALAWGLGRLAKRWIAAGKGCDSTVEVAQVAPGPGARMTHD